MIQRVGLDLDNTIIDYDEVFIEAASRFGHRGTAHSKADVRDLVRSAAGDEAWQRLQGWVYGEGIHKAVPFWGVQEFLLRCARRGLEVHIVSHKTIRGHFSSSQIPLRDVALGWLQGQGLIGGSNTALPMDRVHFAETRDEKIGMITSLEFDVFVDDLVEVLVDPLFPRGTRRIGFRMEQSIDEVEVARSWREVGDLMFGSTGLDEIAEWVSSAAGTGPVQRVERISTGGNSTSMIAYVDDGPIFVKRYPDRQLDPRDRCKVETQALTWMSEKGMPVPSVLWSDDAIGVAAHRFVRGTSIGRPSLEDVDHAAGFVGRLASLARQERPEFGFASEHFDSVSEILRQVEARVESGQSSAYGPCAKYFQSELRPALNRQREVLEATIGSGLSTPLPASERTLSPSDFGFHNSLRTKEGIVFVDFEYFGWDDPAKLVVDFILHPGFESSVELQRRWLEHAESTFGHGVMQRVRSILPLVAIRWESIVLKPFVTSSSSDLAEAEWNRRVSRARAVRSTAVAWSR